MWAEGAPKMNVSTCLPEQRTMWLSFLPINYLFVFYGPWQSVEEKTKSESAEVTLIYIGSGVSLNLYVIDPTDDVIIEQQHCGGNTVVVFRGRVLQGSEIRFVSRRHAQFPFSLTLYVNGRMDCRLSACCEYRHKAGGRLGGKQGHFKLVGVEGGSPCPRCQPEEAEQQKQEQEKKEQEKERDQEKKEQEKKEQRKKEQEKREQEKREQEKREQEKREQEKKEQKKERKNKEQERQLQEKESTAQLDSEAPKSGKSESRKSKSVRSVSEERTTRPENKETGSLNKVKVRTKQKLTAERAENQAPFQENEEPKREEPKRQYSKESTKHRKTNDQPDVEKADELKKRRRRYTNVHKADDQPVGQPKEKSMEGKNNEDVRRSSRQESDQQKRIKLSEDDVPSKQQNSVAESELVVASVEQESCSDEEVNNTNGGSESVVASSNEVAERVVVTEDAYEDDLEMEDAAEAHQVNRKASEVDTNADGEQRKQDDGKNESAQEVPLNTESLTEVNASGKETEETLRSTQQAESTNGESKNETIMEIDEKMNLDENREEAINVDSNKEESKELTVAGVAESMELLRAGELENQAVSLNQSSKDDMDTTADVNAGDNREEKDVAVQEGILDNVDISPVDSSTPAECTDATKDLSAKQREVDVSETIVLNEAKRSTDEMHWNNVFVPNALVLQSERKKIKETNSTEPQEFVIMDEMKQPETVKGCRGPESEWPPAADSEGLDYSETRKPIGMDALEVADVDNKKVNEVSGVQQTQLESNENTEGTGNESIDADAVKDSVVEINDEKQIEDFGEDKIEKKEVSRFSKFADKDESNAIDVNTSVAAMEDTNADKAFILNESKSMEEAQLQVERIQVDAVTDNGPILVTRGDSFTEINSIDKPQVEKMSSSVQEASLDADDISATNAQEEGEKALIIETTENPKTFESTCKSDDVEEKENPDYLEIASNPANSDFAAQQDIVINSENKNEDGNVMIGEELNSTAATVQEDSATLTAMSNSESFSKKADSNENDEYPVCAASQLNNQKIIVEETTNEATVADMSTEPAKLEVVMNQTTGAIEVGRAVDIAEGLVHGDLIKEDYIVYEEEQIANANVQDKAISDEMNDQKDKPLIVSSYLSTSEEDKSDDKETKAEDEITNNADAKLTADDEQASGSKSKTDLTATIVEGELQADKETEAAGVISGNQDTCGQVEVNRLENEARDIQFSSVNVAGESTAVAEQNGYFAPSGTAVRSAFKDEWVGQLTPIREGAESKAISEAENTTQEEAFEQTVDYRADGNFIIDALDSNIENLGEVQFSSAGQKATEPALVIDMGAAATDKEGTDKFAGDKLEEPATAEDQTISEAIDNNAVSDDILEYRAVDDNLAVTFPRDTEPTTIDEDEPRDLNFKDLEQENKEETALNNEKGKPEVVDGETEVKGLDGSAIDNVSYVVIEKGVNEVDQYATSEAFGKEANTLENNDEINGSPLLELETGEGKTFSVDTATVNEIVTQEEEQAVVKGTIDDVMGEATKETILDQPAQLDQVPGEGSTAAAFEDTTEDIELTATPRAEAELPVNDGKEFGDICAAAVEITDQGDRATQNTILETDSKAVLSAGAVEENLSGTSVVNQDLPGTSAADQDMPGTSATDQELPGASIVNQDLPGSSVVDQDLPDTSVVDQVLPNTSVVDQDLHNTSVVDQVLPNTSVVDQDLPNTSVVNRKSPGTTVVDQDLPGATVVNQHMPSTIATDQDLPVTSAAGQDLPDTSLVDQDLPGTTVVDEDLPGATVVDQDMPDTIATDQDLPVTSAVDQDLPGATVVDQDLPDTSAVDQDLPGTTLVDQDLAGTSAVDQDLPGTSAVDQDFPGTTVVDQDLPGTTVVDQDLPGTSAADQDLPGTSAADQDFPGTSPGDPDLPGIIAMDQDLPVSGSAAAIVSVAVDQSAESKETKKEVNGDLPDVLLSSQMAEDLENVVPGREREPPAYSNDPLEIAPAETMVQESTKNEVSSEMEYTKFATSDITNEELLGIQARTQAVDEAVRVPTASDNINQCNAVEAESTVPSNTENLQENLDSREAIEDTTGESEIIRKIGEEQKTAEISLVQSKNKMSSESDEPASDEGIEQTVVTRDQNAEVMTEDQTYTDEQVSTAKLGIADDQTSKRYAEDKDALSKEAVMSDDQPADQATNISRESIDDAPAGKREELDDSQDDSQLTSKMDKSQVVIETETGDSASSVQVDPVEKEILRKELDNENGSSESVTIESPKENASTTNDIGKSERSLELAVRDEDEKQTPQSESRADTVLAPAMMTMADAEAISPVSEHVVNANGMDLPVRELTSDTLAEDMRTNLIESRIDSNANKEITNTLDDEITMQGNNNEISKLRVAEGNTI